MRKLHNILITGGAGFIGSNFIHYLFGMSSAEGNLFNDANFDGTVVNVDCLTYAGNLESLKDVEEKFGGKRYFFEKVDICDRAEIVLVPGDFDHSVTGEKSQKVTRENDQKSHLTPLIIQFPEDCQKQFLPFL